MPPRPQKPRLWLRQERKNSQGETTHKATWFIKDRGLQISTGFSVEQRTQAENELLKYLERRPSIKTYYVYFITADAPDFPIKVGISERHRDRLSTLQCAIPYKLEVLAIIPTIDPLFERRIHRKFAHLRLQGEWFKRAGDLLAYISELQVSHADVPVAATG